MEEQLKNRRAVVQQDSNQLLATQGAEIQSTVNKELLRKQEKERKRNELEASWSYGAVKGIKTILDDYYIDPLLGFFLPGVGDWLTAPLMLPYLYISLFKIHSIALTLAVICNWLMDTCIGCIPFLGDILDFFIKGYKKSYQLIVGYVEDDQIVISEVKRKAFVTLLFIVLLCVALYYVVRLSMSIWDWVVGLFT